jgi:hypothetical protein
MVGTVMAQPMAMTASASVALAACQIVSSVHHHIGEEAVGQADGAEHEDRHRQRKRQPAQLAQHALRVEHRAGAHQRGQRHQRNGQQRDEPGHAEPLARTVSLTTGVASEISPCR